jgi:hypothetical protein
MTQPAKLPRFATDTNFTGGEYDGEPTKVEPSTGLKASGFVPGTLFPFPRANWLWNNIGEHLAALAPMAVDNWSEERSTAMTLASASVGRLFSIGSTRLGFMTRSGVGGAVGPFSYSDLDYRTDGWTECASASIGSWIMPAYGNGFVVTVESTSGDVRKTSDTGATWSSGGTATAIDHLADARLHYFAAAGFWQLIGDSGGDNFITRDADLASVGAWTLQPAPAAVLLHTSMGAGGSHCVDIVSNSTECLALFTNGQVIRTTDGITWSAAALPSFTAGVAGIAWSDSHQLWAVAGTTGKTWFSPTGAVWSAGPTHAWSTPVGTRVASLGRYWVLPADGFLVRFDGTNKATIPERLVFSTQQGVTDIHRHGDRLVIAFVPVSANFLVYKQSLRLIGA